MTAAGQVFQVGVLTMATWTIELLLERGVFYAAGSILAQIVQGAPADLRMQSRDGLPYYGRTPSVLSHRTPAIREKLQHLILLHTRNLQCRIHLAFDPSTHALSLTQQMLPDCPCHASADFAVSQTPMAYIVWLTMRASLTSRLRQRIL